MSQKAALSHLLEADEAADRTQAKMQAQTAQLEKMNADLDTVNANLDTTEAIVGDMEKSYMRYLGEGMLGAVGIDCTTQVQQTQIDTSKPPLREGWLNKRGPMYGYKFEARWVTLFDTGVMWYDDEKKYELKGDFDIRKGTKAVEFNKNKAPGDAIKHRGEKPYGFVVDVNPNAGKGKERKLHYFDAETQPNQKAWIQAIEQGVRALKKKDKGDKDLQLAGDGMDAVNDVLDGLHDKALSMGDEARKQAKLVNQVTTNVDSTTKRLDEQTARVRKL
mmetsp:Transcript_116910/g.202094  ORF Transcript_116910/g.202094 Transcript_116910/m.202094 type:complete len:276 (+) Transcript_116910:62-889(+)